MPTPLRFELPKPADTFRRADLEFHGVDHSGPSFEARVFVNNPGANESTQMDLAHGYADSFFVFGHGGCFGEEGHCDVPTEPRRPNDLRPPHQLTPIDARVVATGPIQAALKSSADQLTVTVVPVIEEEDAADYTDQELLKDPLHIDHVALLTYG
jgi:tyrosinase